MKKTLIVKYTPRNDRSRTKELLDFYTENKLAENEIEVLDLLQDQPEFFDEVSLGAYYKRNYAGVEISTEEKQAIEKFDRFTQQFLQADQVVVAYPMFNFSMPAIVKGYFDMILQKGKTWDVQDGNYVGLQQAKKLVLITTSAGKYEGVEGYDAWEHNIKLMRVIAGFIGAELEVVDGGGIAYDEEATVENAKKQILEMAL